MTKILLFIISLMLAAGTASAALDLSTITIDTSQYFVLVTAIITAIAGIWVVKKIIKLGNRS
ncbi:MAG: hypothetical protein A3I04_01285 [Nitrospinae bacterium RIFCSPLOWO2_02_FULL_39_110]|nr:MAG: hypothetical protein A3D20_03565 [Nitrospinae bacterium RIFCSPHIGHO2_02_FULL_39_82]OGW03998.1 MAG: hypothetical protein A3I04_01285 [Nitrospinae bacterium RIFCSPLOWO2_02_FULL_39_110]